MCHGQKVYSSFKSMYVCVCEGERERERGRERETETERENENACMLQMVKVTEERESPVSLTFIQCR
jgi:hypothetical protein